MGLVYGLSGFCSGPLLGGVLTVAGSAANPMLGGALLFTYALGTAAPLFAIALVWDRFDLGRRGWMRGRPLRLGRWSTHSSRLAAGLLLVVLGASFVAFQGTSALSAAYGAVGLGELGFHLQGWVADHVGANADVLVVVAPIAGGATAWAARVRSRRVGVKAAASED
jgi:hypothetical protein